VEGREESAPEPASGRAPARTELEQQLADLQVQCNDNREALGRLKAQKEAAERRARIAAKAAENAQTSTPTASAGSSSNQGGSGQNQYRNQGNYRGRGRGRSQPGRSGACHNVANLGIGPMSVLTHRHPIRHRHRHLHRSHHHRHPHQQVVLRQ